MTTTATAKIFIFSKPDPATRNRGGKHYPPPPPSTSGFYFSRITTADGIIKIRPVDSVAEATDFIAQEAFLISETLRMACRKHELKWTSPPVQAQNADAQNADA